MPSEPHLWEDPVVARAADPISADLVTSQNETTQDSGKQRKSIGWFLVRAEQLI